MATIAFLLLAHKEPERVIAQAHALTAHGDSVTIHFDRRAPKSAFDAIRSGLRENTRVAFAPRIRCGWGMWSLVSATLGMIRTARAAFRETTHYYLISGDCYPTKSRGYLDRYLAENADRDIIEINDFADGTWIRTGLTRERICYRHWFNERERKTLFYGALELQRRLGLERTPPDGLEIRIGSQWWLMRASTVEAILAAVEARPEIERFFRTTWIPDEIFFQTMAADVVPLHQILPHPPTHLIFSDYGMPVVFHNDHEVYLRAQDRLFARKLSTGADGLRTRLLGLFSGEGDGAAEGGTSGDLYGYLTRRGREGQRYAPRFWERAISPVGHGELLIIAAKIWHVGKAVEQAISEETGLPRLGYLFEEEGEIDVDLGHLEVGLQKRGRHRRALMNLVMDGLDGRRALLCIDPSRHDLIKDLLSPEATIRILAVEREISNDHLDDHAVRTGLVTAGSGAFERDELRRALRYEFDTEIDRLRRAHTDIVFRNRLDRPREDNVLDLGFFLRCRRVEAEAIARAAEHHLH